MNQETPSVALVTGGSRGLGEAIVRRLHAGGHSVAFTYLSNEARARRLVEELGEQRLLALRADLRDVDLTVVRSDALPDDAREAYGHGGMLHVIRPDGYLGFRGHLRDREALVAYAQRVGLAPVAFRAG